MTANKKDLRVFMRESAKTEEIVTAPGPDTILGEDGKPVTLEIKVLSSATIQKINDNYKKRAIAVDKKGTPIVANGEVVFRSEKDNIKASMHILVEALVYPDLKDPDLMAFYECRDITEMPFKVFPRSDEFAHVNRVVMAALGLGNEVTREDKEETLDDIKN